MQVHLDGDVIVYRAGYAAEHNIYEAHWAVDGAEHIRNFEGSKAYKSALEAGEVPKSHWLVNRVEAEPVDAALFNVHSIIKSVATELQADLDEEVKVYLSGPRNYRIGLATIKPYKGNRDPTKKPVHAAAIKELMRGRYGASTTDGIEADDAMATAHYALYVQDSHSSCIATIDKDLDTVPGMHYNFVTKATYFVQPGEALRNFWHQMITGDTVDNIPGIPRAGKAKADKVLGPIVDYGMDLADLNVRYYDLVRPLYVESYGENADAALLEMGQLLYIQKQEGELWRPPTTHKTIQE